MTAQIFVTTTVPEGELGYFRTDAERLVRLLSNCPGVDVQVLGAQRHVRDARMVLFVGSSQRALQDVRASPYYREHLTKCFVVHSGDEPLPTLPGIYASVPRCWYDPFVHRAGFYLRTAVDASNEGFADLVPRHLFSFVGAGANHPVRAAILALRSTDGFLLDSALHPATPELAKERFMESLRSSQFVLCPRGGGTSSFRIFETMMAGRVPVIIADDWVEPLGPHWPDFSVRVLERDVSQLPSLLKLQEPRARQMGREARKSWETWFSQQTAGPTLLNWLQELESNLVQRNGRKLTPKLALHAAADSLRTAVGSARKAVRARHSA